MTVEMLKGKIHRATVVQAELNYVGSITVDQDLLDASGILEYEKVQIVDIDNGSRFATYTIAGERGSGIMCLNGAAARCVCVGDKIILRASEVAYAPLEDGNETTVVKYKFNGWYVNGVKVSDDLEYVYTVTESCLVYADYKASTYETASDDNGISPSVLVIGIAAVIVALIAVVYTVIQKKE